MLGAVEWKGQQVASTQADSPTAQAASTPVGSMTVLIASILVVVLTLRIWWTARDAMVVGHVLVALTAVVLSTKSEFVTNTPDPEILRTHAIFVRRIPKR